VSGHALRSVEPGNRALDFHRIAILGPGLLGGSLALAIRHFCPGIKINLWARRGTVVEEIQRRGIADLASTDLSSVIAEADLIILATPVGIMEELSRAIVELGGVAPNCIVTDVGSVKESVTDVFDKVFADGGIDALGSHPMAGSEKTGIEHARADLFEGAPCVITPPAGNAENEIAKKLEVFWQTIGMKTCCMDPSEHDRLVARISHLPHLVAAAMVNVAFCDGEKATSLAGMGFLDSTRIAAGPPEMWTEILSENRVAVMSELKRLQTKLGETLAFLEDMNDVEMMRFLAEAKEHRDSLDLPASGQKTE